MAALGCRLSRAYHANGSYRMRSGSQTTIHANRNLTGSLHPEQSFKLLEKLYREGRESVESRCGAVALGSALSVAAPFVWRCPSSRSITPFPHPAHRTGHADFPHPALGQDTYLCTRKVIRGSPATAQSCVTPASIEPAFREEPPMPPPGRSFAARIQSGFFLRFSMWRLPQLLHINGVS